MIWLKYIGIQLVMLLATVVGWFLLLPVCIDERWNRRAMSIKDKRDIDQWNSVWLQTVYGNPEDGVSGQTARVWLSGGVQGPYMPNAPGWWRAYCWSAWRNSCDNLKYVFADPSGPLVTFKLFGRTAKLGWQGGLPVLSL